MIDLTDLTEADLDALRVAVLTEQERRATVTGADEQIAALTARAEAAAAERTTWEPAAG